MLFVSWSFAVFLPVVLLLYYGSGRQGWQVSAPDPGQLCLLRLGESAIGALAGSVGARECRGVPGAHLAGRSELRRRWVLALALIYNLGALIFFKYAALVGEFSCRPPCGRNGALG